MIKNPVTTFMAIFGINTSYLTTYLNLRKIEDGKLSPSTNPPTRIIKKKSDFKKADYQSKIEDSNFVHQNNIPKENQLDPTGVQAHPFGG